MKTKLTISLFSSRFLPGFSRLFSTLTAAAIVTVFGFQALAQTSEQILERSTNPPACIQNLARSMGNSNWPIVRQWNSLENQYCERMQIGYFESAFSEGKDLPAEKLKTDWQKPEEVLNDSRTDASIILDLNQQAKNLWDELVSCNGSPEKARQAYLKLDNKCNLNNKIQNYSSSVQSFLMTTTPPTKGSFLNISFHPLFTELLLENANATSWMPAYDPMPNSELSYYYGLINKFVVGGYSLDDLNKPEKSREIQMQFFALTRIKDEADLQGMMAFKYRQINSVRFLQMNSAKDCESLGLWPGASRVIVHELSKDSSNYDIGSDQLVETYMKACGNFQYTNHAYSGESRTSFSIAKDFRKIAIRFNKK